MAKAARKPGPEININLLPSEGSKGTASEAVHWLLTIGRYLIIFTEIVALAIFVLSIILSAEKNALKEDIRTLGDQVTAQESFEKEFRQVTNQISEIKRLYGSRSPSNIVLAEFLNLLPEGMKIDKLELNEEKVTFAGSFSSPSQLQTMVSSFSQSEKLVGLDLTKLSAPDESKPDFTLEGSISIFKSKF